LFLLSLLCMIYLFLLYFFNLFNYNLILYLFHILSRIFIDTFSFFILILSFDRFLRRYFNDINHWTPTIEFLIFINLFMIVLLFLLYFDITIYWFLSCLLLDILYHLKLLFYHNDFFYLIQEVNVVNKKNNKKRWLLI